MHHVIFLRMQLAAKLLGQSDDKIETVARVVGCENPFAFSTAFKEWVGWRPGDYRAGQRRSAAELCPRPDPAFAPPPFAGIRVTFP